MNINKKVITEQITLLGTYTYQIKAQAKTGTLNITLHNT